MQLSATADEALLELLGLLKTLDYGFTTPTPETHRRVVARADMQEAGDLRGVFGWSLPFAPGLLRADMLALLEQAEALRREGASLKSLIRVSRIHGTLFLHSAYPTEAEDAVFFGPDSYRFVDFVRSELLRVGGARRLVDIGAGGGVGAIMAAALLPGARLTLTDINPVALRLARINARQAGVEVETIEGKGIEPVTGLVDLVISNPPFIMDGHDRSYRNGGDMHGARLSLDWTLAATRRLEPGGRMLLYTGSAIVDGRDALRDALETALPALGASLRYREIDPDIFGEELDEPAYADVERIAAVGAVIEKARSGSLNSLSRRR
jgi:methylase of polypeptide subunit release factors